MAQCLTGCTVFGDADPATLLAGESPGLFLRTVTTQGADVSLTLYPAVGRGRQAGAATDWRRKRV